MNVPKALENFKAAGLVGDWLECVGKIFEGLDDGMAGGGEDLPCRNEGFYGVGEDVEEMTGFG